MKTFSCFQHMEIISSVHGTPMWMPINTSSGKSMATWSSRIGLATDGRRRSLLYTRLWPTCIMIGMSSSQHLA